MFCNCTSLTTAPELPALTLAHSCYESMFAECINLTNPPELPATTLVSACYSIFTILRGEDDAMIEYNRTEYFEVTSDFDIYLPQPKVEGGISA